jgi:hypothetical protein
MLTIAELAVAMLATGARATARRVDDVGVRRLVAGAMIAVPYAVLIGGVNAGVTLHLRSSGGWLPGSTSIAAPVGEGFLLPGALALVAGIVGGWSTSVSRNRAGALAVRAGIRAFGWAMGLSFVALLAFAALRPEGLERYSIEMWSGGPQRAGLYAGHQALLLPNQAMWVLAPSMGGCVTSRTDEAAHDLVCLDRIPRGPSPATWLLSELGRVDGSPPTAPMPAAAWLFVAVPVGAIVLGFRSLGRTARSVPHSVARGAVGGVVFAVLVSATSLAASLWLSLRSGETVREVALGPDPVTTAVLAFVWGVAGGVAVCVGGTLVRRLSRRGAPR